MKDNQTNFMIQSDLWRFQSNWNYVNQQIPESVSEWSDVRFTKASLYRRNRLKRYREFLSNRTRIICRLFVTEGTRYSKFKVISTEFRRQLSLDTKRNTWEGSFVKNRFVSVVQRDSRACTKKSWDHNTEHESLCIPVFFDYDLFKNWIIMRLHLSMDNC